MTSSILWLTKLAYELDTRTSGVVRQSNAGAVSIGAAASPFTVEIKCHRAVPASRITAFAGSPFATSAFTAEAVIGADSADPSGPIRTWNNRGPVAILAMLSIADSPTPSAI